MKTIARIHTDFSEKFGIPRQSGLVRELEATICFEPEYRNIEALRGLEGFNYIWLIWQFDGTDRSGWSATVKPPRLGGKKRMGVFATRSPFRPNPIGLSSVMLEKIADSADGPILHVRGADLKDGTRILDIKPYIPYADCHTDATGGFSTEVYEYQLEVDFPDELRACFPANKLNALVAVLSEDPRPASQREQNKEYGIAFAEYNVRFTVNDRKLSVTAVEKM